jgi:hypothetical protein
MADPARDISGFVEELILTGVYAETLPLIDELAAAAKAPAAVAPEACRKAIESVGRSTALAEAAVGLGDQTAEEYDDFTRLVCAVGPATVPGLLPAYGREDGSAGGERAARLLVRLGVPALPAVAAAIDDPRWFVQRDLARVLGQIGTPAAVPPLQTLVRRPDGRIMRAAVTALAGIDDRAAGRALHMALKAATGETRAAVITALVGLKNTRVVPLLVQMLQEGQPFGSEHPLVLDMLAALGALQDDRATAAIAAMARQRRWLAWRKTAGLRHASLHALVRIGTDKARAALADLARTGDLFLQRQIRRTMRES